VGCSAAALYEPEETLVMHHHPYRSLEHTAARLEIVARRGTWDHLEARRHSIEAVFRGDYANVLNYRTKKLGISPGHGPSWVVERGLTAFRQRGRGSAGYRGDGLR